MLRQNPDAVLVGDIPDSRTATVVANAARDRLVLASMTNLNAVHCAEKLAGLAMDRSELASILKAIISQRLVRKLCPKCKESYEPDAAEVSPFGLNPGISLYKGKGCDNCNYSGYKGRIALAQVLVASEGLREALKSGADVEKINAAAIEEGLASLAEAGGKLWKKELTTTEELRRVIGEESSSGTVLRPKALVKPFSSGEKPLKEVEKVLRPLRRSQEPRQDGEERKCPECSEKVKGGWKICPYCGKSLLEKPELFVCPSCDEKVDGKWNLCPNCGADLKAGREEAQESPVSSADEPALSNERPKIEGHPRVLVVDDQRSMQKLVSIALKGIDCEVFTAADGIEALEKVKRVKPHLIILDIVMPRMDGLEVCRRLRADVRTAFIPIIMLTSLSDKKSRLKGYVAGTDDYLAKPFMMEEFYTRVHNLLRRTYGYQSDHDDLVDVGNEWDSATEDYRKEQKIRDLQEHQRMLEQEKHEDGMET
ncbi:MAG: ATPase, T2SS/T4P/T4SS family [Planctomycetota bacterium]|nr:ATPase, T2SS/T4P/T4SS family [Planctomycetota bacterium]